MKKDKKFLLIFPPAWLSVEPHLACPSLLSSLRTNGFNAKIIDLNIEFMNYIFNSKYIQKSFHLAKEQYDSLLKQKESFINKNDTYENKILNSKYSTLNDFFQKYSSKLVDSVINSIDSAVNVYKNEKYFYNYKNAVKANRIMSIAAYLISLPYSPLFVDMFKSDIPKDIMPLNYKDIKKVVFDDSVNIYREFFEHWVSDIEKEDYAYIGISINSKSQLIAGLTIANILKQRTNAHINIGGTFFSFVKESLENHPDFFEFFANSVSYGEGELSIVELAKYINEEIPIEKVSGLIYKKEENVIFNEQRKNCVLSRIPIPDWTDYDFSKYFSPVPVLPIQTQRGCYWRKCTFCDMSYGKTYTVKRINDLIDEIKYYKKEYNICHFDIIDEAVVPSYLDKLFEAIIANNLEIRFQLSLRMEKEIDYKFLKKGYKAGLRYIQWGVETGNKRIHNLINKGVDFKNRQKILKDTNKAGIMNCAFTLYGFPSETYKEAMDTYKFIFKNKKYIQSSGASPFNLTRHSIIKNTPEKFGVIIDKEQPDFWYGLNFKTSTGMSEIEKNKYSNEFSNTYKKSYRNTIFYHLPDYTLIFLYNCKHNLDYLKKINTDIL